MHVNKYIVRINKQRNSPTCCSTNSDTCFISDVFRSNQTYQCVETKRQRRINKPHNSVNKAQDTNKQTEQHQQEA